MNDELTKIALGAGGVIAAKELITKLLGPTAEYLGDGIRDFAEKGGKNIRRILMVACKKLKDDLNTNGQVNPRVFSGIWNDGRFVEDVIAAEYFGGLLAASRSADGRDDDAVQPLALVRSMSSCQLRLHFIIYSLISRHPFDVKEGSSKSWTGLSLTIDAGELLSSMKLTGPDAGAKLLSAVTGLIQCRLLGESFAMNCLGVRECANISPQDDLVTVAPIKNGASLYMKALGLRGVHPELITSLNVDYSLSEEVRASLQLPRAVTYARHQSAESIAARAIREYVDGVVGELQSDVDDLKTEKSEGNDRGNEQSASSVK